MEDEFVKMDMELKMDSVKDFELLSQGVYECKYVGTTKKESELDGEPSEYFRHKWEVVGTGKWLFENSSTKLSPKSKMGEIVMALGIELKPGQTLNMTSLVGLKCQLYVSIEEKEGKTYNIIKTHIPLKKA